jgi:hypothetical protein
MKIGFIGLGTMGAPMASHLIDKGHEVTVWNRSPEKTIPLAECGAQVAAQIQDLAELPIIISCVGGSQDAEEVLLAVGSRQPTLYIDHSTIEPKAAVAIGAKLRELGHEFVDAPVTGGSMGAQNGTLTIFLGGAPDVCVVAETIVCAYGKNVRRVGDSGAGQWMKLANQIAVGGALAGLCESLAFAQRAGLDISVAKEMIGKGAGGSWAFDNYGPKILHEDWTPGFSIRNQVKDFRYVLAAAEELGLSLPATHAVNVELESMLAEFGGETTAALFRRLVSHTNQVS